MAYASAAEVIASFNTTRMAELTADSGSTPDSTRITNEITTASDLVDSYLLSRYTTPVTGPAAVLAAIKPHAVALVLYGLFQDRLLAEAYSSIRDDRDRAAEDRSLGQIATDLLAEPAGEHRRTLADQVGLESVAARLVEHHAASARPDDDGGLAARSRTGAELGDGSIRRSSGEVTAAPRAVREPHRETCTARPRT